MVFAGSRGASRGWSRFWLVSFDTKAKMRNAVYCERPKTDSGHRHFYTRKGVFLLEKVSWVKPNGESVESRLGRIFTLHTCWSIMPNIQPTTFILFIVGLHPTYELGTTAITIVPSTTTGCICPFGSKFTIRRESVFYYKVFTGT